MTKFIQTINLIHSVIFFITASLFSIILDQYENLTVSPVICLLLILSIGISHGSLDGVKGRKLLNFYNTKNMTKFYFTYVAISLSILVLWLIFPTISLIFFLILASYHFGKEDTQFLIIKKSRIDLVLYFFKGLLIIIAPLFFHFTETVNIFKLLLIENENFYTFLGFVEDKNILSIIFLFSLFSYIFYFVNKFKNINILLFFDFFSIIILNYSLSPLVAFTIYFCFLHSLRHSISLIVQLDSLNFKNGFFIFLRKTIPLTIFTMALCLISLYFISNFYTINDTIIKIIFIGLASLAFPHILLEYIIEKNES